MTLCISNSNAASAARNAQGWLCSVFGSHYSNEHVFVFVGGKKELGRLYVGADVEIQGLCPNFCGRNGTEQPRSDSWQALERNIAGFTINDGLSCSLLVQQRARSPCLEIASLSSKPHWELGAKKSCEYLYPISQGVCRCPPWPPDNWPRDAE